MCAAGVAAGTIDRHVESKEGLLRGVHADSYAEWLTQAREALDRPGTAPRRLLRFGEVSVRFNRSNRLLDAVLDRDTDVIFAGVIEELHDSLLDRNGAMMAT
jgi:AcrR family transcriptional regulator